jgi:hypothetical protein
MVFPLAVVWGHAEDALTMTFTLYAMIAMLDRKWSRFGWLLGFAVVMQPLSALLLPLFVAASPTGQRLMLLVRSSILSIVLIGVAAAGDASDTFRAVVQQPAFPSTNHATPWLALVPRIPAATERVGQAISFARQNGRIVVHSAPGYIIRPDVVAGGLGRTVYLLGAVLLGLFVWRRPQTPERLLWLAAAVLAARCAFEAVMCPYYLTPPLILALVVVGRRGWRALVPATILALEISLFAYSNFSPWLWWIPVVTCLGLILALGFPREVAASVSEVEAENDRSEDGLCDEHETRIENSDREPVLL